MIADMLLVLSGDQLAVLENWSRWYHISFAKRLWLWIRAFNVGVAVQRVSGDT